MSSFTIKMHQVQFRLGLCPRPRGKGEGKGKGGAMCYFASGRWRRSYATVRKRWWGLHSELTEGCMKIAGSDSTVSEW